MKKKEFVLIFFLIVFIIANLANIVFILSVDVGGRTSARASYGEISLYITSSAAPTPTPTPTPGVAGGGEGRVYDFFIDQNLIEVMIRQGETFKTSLKIKNTESVSQEFKIDTNMKQYVAVSDDSFILAGGEEKIVYLTFFSTDDTQLGAYPGKVIISTSTKKKEIPVILTVKSKRVLFDISLDIPAKYKELLPGEDLLLQLTLFNLGDFGRVDVSIEYLIKDFDGNLILSQDGVVAVETQTSFVKTISLPKNIRVGDYVAIVYVRYGDSFGSSSDIFHIIEKEIPLWYKQYMPIILILSFFVIVIGVFFFLFDLRLKKSIRRQAREIRLIARTLERQHIKMIDAVKLVEKLKLQLSILGRAYSKGYINERDYIKNKLKLKKLYVRVRNKYLSS